MSSWVKVFIVLGLVTVFSQACRNVIFDNPLDPNASRPELLVVKVVDTEIRGKGGMCWDGEKLWKVAEGSLFALEPESGSVLKSFPLGNGAVGVAFLNQSLYVAYQDGHIDVVDPVSGTVLDRFSLGEVRPSYIASSQDRLFVFDELSKGLIALTLPGGMQPLFSLSGFECGGLEGMDGKLAFVEAASLVLYLFEENGRVHSSYDIPPAEPSGLAWDGAFLYLFSVDGRLYRLSLP